MPNSTTIQLAQEVYQEFLKIKRSYESRGEHLSRNEICVIISTLPAPRFYISPSSALRQVIRPLENGHPLLVSGLRAQMHKDLYSRYCRLRKTHGRYTAIKKAIKEPAPSYYLSPRRIANLLYVAIKK